MTAHARAPDYARGSRVYRVFGLLARRRRRREVLAIKILDVLAREVRLVARVLLRVRLLRLEIVLLLLRSQILGHAPVIVPDPLEVLVLLQSILNDLLIKCFQ